MIFDRITIEPDKDGRPALYPRAADPVAATCFQLLVSARPSRLIKITTQQLLDLLAGTSRETG
jgi:hypothetical protein